MERRGDVYIRPGAPVPADGSMIDPAAAQFAASWQDREVLEDAIVVGGEAAVAWGRERADRVWIRLGNRTGTYFAAGDDTDANGLPRWPPAAPPAKGWWTQPPTPTLDEAHAMLAAVEAASTPVEQAKEWARLRLNVADFRGEHLPRPLLRALADLATYGDPVGFAIGGLDPADERADG